MLATVHGVTTSSATSFNARSCTCAFPVVISCLSVPSFSDSKRGREFAIWLTCDTAGNTVAVISALCHHPAKHGHRSPDDAHAGRGIAPAIVEVMQLRFASFRRRAESARTKPIVCRAGRRQGRESLSLLSSRCQFARESFIRARTAVW